MQTVLLIVHLVFAAALVGLVLMQRSEGGALGVGGGGGGLISGRGAADVLVRVTAILGGLFFLTSLTLTFLAGSHRQDRSVIDRAPVEAPATVPAPAPAPAPQPVRAAPLQAAPPEGAAIAPSPTEAVDRAGPVAAPPALVAPAAPAPAAKALAPAPTAPAAKTESAQPAPVVVEPPAQPQPRPRAGPDE